MLARLRARLRALARPYMPPLWLMAYWFFCWATRDMRHDHPELAEAWERRKHYADLLGFPDNNQHRTMVATWMPRMPDLRWLRRLPRLRAGR